VKAPIVVRYEVSRGAPGVNLMAITRCPQTPSKAQRGSLEGGQPWHQCSPMCEVWAGTPRSWRSRHLQWKVALRHRDLLTLSRSGQDNVHVGPAHDRARTTPYLILVRPPRPAHRPDCIEHPSAARRSVEEYPLGAGTGDICRRTAVPWPRLKALVQAARRWIYGWSGAS